VSKLSQDCSQAYLTHSSLCSFRHIRLRIRYSEVKRSVPPTVIDKAWNTHVQRLTALAELLGKPSGGLRQLELVLLIYVNETRPVLCLHLEPEKWSVRSLLRAFRMHVINKYISARAFVGNKYDSLEYDSQHFEDNDEESERSRSISHDNSSF